MRKNK